MPIKKFNENIEIRDGHLDISNTTLSTITSIKGVGGNLVQTNQDSSYNPNNYPIWQNGTAYHFGDIVYFGGDIYTTTLAPVPSSYIGIDPPINGNSNATYWVDITSTYNPENLSWFNWNSGDITTINGVNPIINTGDKFFTNGNIYQSKVDNNVANITDTSTWTKLTNYGLNLYDNETTYNNNDIVHYTDPNGGLDYDRVWILNFRSEQILNGNFDSDGANWTAGSNWIIGNGNATFTSPVIYTPSGILGPEKINSSNDIVKSDGVSQTSTNSFSFQSSGNNQAQLQISVDLGPVNHSSAFVSFDISNYSVGSNDGDLITFRGDGGNGNDTYNIVITGNGHYTITIPTGIFGGVYFDNQSFAGANITNLSVKYYVSESYSGTNFFLTSDTFTTHIDTIANISFGIIGLHGSNFVNFQLLDSSNNIVTETTSNTNGTIIITDTPIEADTYKVRFIATDNGSIFSIDNVHLDIPQIITSQPPSSDWVNNTNNNFPTYDGTQTSGQVIINNSVVLLSENAIGLYMYVNGDENQTSIIKNATNPVDPQDVATKNYVDTKTNFNFSSDNRVLLSNISTQLPTEQDKLIWNDPALEIQNGRLDLTDISTGHKSSIKHVETNATFTNQDATYNPNSYPIWNNGTSYIYGDNVYYLGDVYNGIGGLIPGYSNTLNTSTITDNYFVNQPTQIAIDIGLFSGDTFPKTLYNRQSAIYNQKHFFLFGGGNSTSGDIPITDPIVIGVTDGVRGNAWFRNTDNSRYQFKANVTYRLTCTPIFSGPDAAFGDIHLNIDKTSGGSFTQVHGSTVGDLTIEFTPTEDCQLLIFANEGGGDSLNYQATIDNFTIEVTAINSDLEDLPPVVLALSYGLRTGYDTNNNYIIERTTNNGVSWTNVYTGNSLSNESSLSSIDGVTIYSYAAGTGIVKSTNSGITWTASTSSVVNTLSGQMVENGIWTDRTSTINPSHYGDWTLHSYVVGDFVFYNGEIYQCIQDAIDDDGIDINNTAYWTKTTNNGTIAEQGYTTQASPTDLNTIHHIGDKVYYVSPTDSYLSFTEIFELVSIPQLPTTGGSKIVIGTNNDIMIIPYTNINDSINVKYANHIFISNNGGSTFKYQGFPISAPEATFPEMSFVNVSSFNSTSIIIGGGGAPGNTMSRVVSTDYGVSWNMSNIGIFSNGFALYQSFSDSLNGYLIADTNNNSTPNRIAYTSDGGASWIQTTSLPTFTTFPTDMQSLNSATDIILTENAVFKTTDNGSSWSSIGLNSTANTLFYLNSTTGWIDGSYQYITTNGGVDTATPITSQPPSVDWSNTTNNGFAIYDGTQTTGNVVQNNSVFSLSPIGGIYVYNNDDTSIITLIKNVHDPIDTQDVATKNYVDTITASKLITNSTVISELTNVSNWTSSVYTGPGITEAEGKFYYDSNYMFFFVTPTIPIRTTRQ